MVFRILLQILIPFFLLEVFLRIINFDTYSFRGYPYNYFIQDNVNKYDINLNIKKKFNFKEFPHEIWGNNIGCFDKDLDININDYILLIGDSVSWGYVPYENNWGNLLEKKLNKDVLQCGVPGYGTKQQYNKIQKILSKLKNKPELIILQYTFTNDLLNDYLFPQYRVQDGFLITNNQIKSFLTGEISVNKQSKIFKKIKYFLNEYSYSFRFFHKFHAKIKRKFKKNNSELKVENNNNLNNYYPFHLPYLDEKEFNWLTLAWEDHLQNILNIKKLTEEFNINFLFVFYGTIPDYASPYFIDAKNKKITLTLDNENKVLEFIKLNNINYINISKVIWEYANYKSIFDESKLKGDLLWNYDVGHPNIKGHNFFSLHISNKILESKLTN
tara:strand:+ start:710 stop:1867 length:1158 start_codon:yes stop_codon:yes gene_type:complete